MATKRTEEELQIALAATHHESAKDALRRALAAGPSSHAWGEAEELIDGLDLAHPYGHPSALEPIGPRAELYELLRAWYVASGKDMALAHLCTSAIGGDVWARDRILAALGAIDPTRPDGTTARGGLVP